MYDSATYNSPNLLKRFSHRARFKVAADLAKGSVLDYGCADGYFTKFMGAMGRTVVGYEPVPSNTPTDGTPYVQTLVGLGQFDCITCLEVLEHIPTQKMAGVLSDFRRHLKHGGTLIASVPVMIGPPGMLKAIISNDPCISAMSALRYLSGFLPPRVPYYEDGGFTHAGFDYRDMRLQLRAVFSSVEELSCPMPYLPPWMNSQLFFICKNAN